MISKLFAAAGAALCASGTVAVATATTAAAPAAACGAPTVVYHAQITDRGTAVGYVDLEHNLACHSVRAHIHEIYVSHPGDSHGANASVIRNDGARADCSVGNGAQDCYTGWLFDGDPHTSYAHGEIDMYPVNYDLAQANTSSF